MNCSTQAKAPMKVLAVDDTPQNLLALQALLQDEPIELLCADSGDAALELLLRHEVALALLDVQMPGMDGYALAEMMRGAERTRHVPIIFLTASGPDERRSFRGYEAGAVDFLFKPIDPLVLRSKIKVFTDLYAQRRELAERIAEQERLQQVNSLMLSALTHDIRAPLAALVLNAELLLRRGDETGRRVKAATTAIGRHVDHLVNLASRPSCDLRPQLAPGSLGELVQSRLQVPDHQSMTPAGYVLTVEGDDQAMFDATLVAQALDQLLLQAVVHAGDAMVRILVDGQSRRSVAVRLQFTTPLGATAAVHLFGNGPAADGISVPKVGHGLHNAERIARAHGGSVIGRSKEKEGTLFELLLPRGL